MFESLALYIEGILDSIDSVSAERQTVLDQAAEYISGKLKNTDSANLTFICTHNSRRSHLAQVWCQVAAHHYGMANVHAFSGGTEATACNIRTVEAMRRAGLEITESSGGNNPLYHAKYALNSEPIKLYSKIYDTPENPQSEYAAMMCCSDVDESCPVVHGSEIRIPLHYRDPKESDDTSIEAQTYDKRCLDIAIELFYIMSKVRPVGLVGID